MPFEDDIIEVETPERVELSFPIAGLGSRFIAVILDNLIIGAIQFVIFIIILIPLGSLGQTDAYLVSSYLGIMILVNFILSTGYFIYFEYVWNGQTPGKRVVNIRVMRHGGLPMNLASSMIRNLMRTVDLILLSIAVGFLFLFLSKLSQRTGDFAAGTFVVRDRSVTLQDLDRYLVEPSEETRPRYETGIDRRFGKLSDDDAQLISAFMLRRREMDLSQRREMGNRIALNIRKKSGLKPDDFSSNEILIKTAHQALKEREGNW